MRRLKTSSTTARNGNPAQARLTLQAQHPLPADTRTGFGEFLAHPQPAVGGSGFGVNLPNPPGHDNFGDGAFRRRAIQPSARVAGLHLEHAAQGPHGEGGRGAADIGRTADSHDRGFVCPMRFYLPPPAKQRSGPLRERPASAQQHRDQSKTYAQHRACGRLRHRRNRGVEAQVVEHEV